MDTNSENNVIKIHQNRIKNFFFLFLFLCTSVLMLISVFFANLQKIENIFIFCIALFSTYIAFVAFKNFLGGKKEALLISKDGICDCSTKDVFFIKWQDIEYLKSLPKPKNILIICKNGKGKKIKNIFTKKIQTIDFHTLQATDFQINFKDLENILFEKFKENIKSYKILKNKNKHIIISLNV